MQFLISLVRGQSWVWPCEMEQVARFIFTTSNSFREIMAKSNYIQDLDNFFWLGTLKDNASNIVYIMIEKLGK
jgi:hypothetical protein